MNEEKQLGLDNPERYFPKDYPRILIHGTSSELFQKIQDTGFMADGTFTTDITASLDPRFTSGDSVFLISQFDPKYYQLAERNPHVWFDIKDGCGGVMKNFILKKTSSDNSRGDDEEFLKTTNTYIPTEKFSALKLNVDQKEAVSIFIGVVSAVSTVHDYDIFPEKKSKDAFILGVEETDLDSLDLMRNKLSQIYPTEQHFIESVMSRFPGDIEWVNNPMNFDGKIIMRNILLQIYQAEIVRQIQATLKGKEVYKTFQFKNGDSAKGLLELGDKVKYWQLKVVSKTDEESPYIFDSSKPVNPNRQPLGGSDD
jgi:hypothetical protein